jgi:protein TonB
MKNKKQYLLLVGFLLSSIHLFAGTNSAPGDAILPKPKIDVQEFFSRNVRYPDLAAETGVMGTVYVKAYVTSEGSLDSVSLKEGVYSKKHPKAAELLNNEGVRVVKLIPAGSFTPGSVEGKPIGIWITVPVRFQIN